jgi:predicted MFS family arabinose efflux permease
VNAGSAGAALSRARTATAAIFFAIGATFGDWVSRVPGIQEQAHARNGPLGAALLCIAGGAMAARPGCSRLVRRYGSGGTTRAIAWCCCLSLMLPALAGNVWVLALSLAAFGAALGSVDVAMNAHAVALERQFGRPIMSSFHGIYSVGGLIGTLAGGRAAMAGLSPLQNFMLLAPVLSGVALIASWNLLPSSLEAVPREGRSGRLNSLPKEYRILLLLLGVIGLCGMAAEGAVGDWGAVYLHDDLATSVNVASWGYAAYSLAMIVGRLLGSPCMQRWGEWRVVTCATTTAAVGFALALLIDSPDAALCGFVVLGLGLSVVVPVTISQASRVGSAATAAAVAFVSSLGQLGPVVVPPFIGFLAEPLGLPAALGTVSALALIAVGLVQIIRHQTDDPREVAHLLSVASAK